MPGGTAHNSSGLAAVTAARGCPDSSGGGVARLLLWVVVLLVMLLAWDRPASGDDDPCPDGYERAWVDPIGTVCRNLDTGDPVRIDYARRLAGLPSYNDAYLDPPTPDTYGVTHCESWGIGWYHDSATSTCRFRATPANADSPHNPGCLGPHCRFEDTSRDCEYNARDYDLYNMWGACEAPADNPGFGPDPGPGCWERTNATRDAPAGPWKRCEE